MAGAGWLGWYTEPTPGKVKCKYCAMVFARRNSRLLSHLGYVPNGGHRYHGKLAKISDGFQCEGGHFVVPSYKLYVNFGKCDGVVEIIWRANLDLHATSPSTTKLGFSRIGTSVQIPRSLVRRVLLLKKDERNGENVNPRVRGLKEIVEQKIQKLHDNK